MVRTILDEAQQRGILFYLNEAQQLAFKAPPGAFCDEFKATVTAHKSALIEYLKRAVAQTNPVMVDRNGELPLSHAQQRLWFIHMLDGASAQYNIPMALTLRGQLDLQGLQYALNALVERHEILRTVYVNQQGQGKQKVCSAVEITVDFTDLSGMALSEQDARLSVVRKEFATKPFDLSRDLMFRAALVKRNDNEYVLLLTLHHIAADGWSMGILVKEFSKLYSEFVANLPSSLPALDLQYVDYAVWQQAQLTGVKSRESLQFWQQQLADIPASHSLPLDFPRPANQSFAGAQVQTVVAKAQLQALEQLATKHNCTLFMLLQTAFAVLIAKWSRQTDVVIGTPLAGRNHKSFENVIGFFINSLTLRSKVDPKLAFSAFLDVNRAALTQAFNHQEVPFEQLLESLKVERSLSHTPLFQIMFSLQNFSSSTLELPLLSVESMQPVAPVAKFDLDLSATVAADGLHLNWLYATSLFSKSTIQSLCESYYCLLMSIVANPEQPIEQLAIADTKACVPSVTLASRRSHGWFPQHWVEDRAANTPLFNALKSYDGILNYYELNAAANTLANRWLQQGVTRGQRIALCLAPSVNQILALLAIWKLGATIVPMDPTYPIKRLEYILNDSQATWLISESNDALIYGNWQRLDITFGDDTSNLAIDVAGHDCAYIIYTSGTTGRPKGVMVSFDALSSHIAAMSESLHIGPNDTVLPFASLSVDAAFDLSLSAWYQGATLAIRPVGIPTAEQFYRVCQELAVNVLDLPPAYLVDLLSQAATAQPFWSSGQIRLVVLGGEAMSPTIMRLWDEWQLFDRCCLVNAYGPTETVITATLKRFERAQPISIGQPLGRRQAYVLNDAMCTVPAGALGELYIAGEDLALGYLGSRTHTAERFIHHPQFGRMYKTGDLVRLNELQELLYIGRVDDQIQIRGFRVEPMEVRAALQALSYVHECFVKVQQEPTGAILVGYVKLNKVLDCDNVIEKLFEDLKAYLAIHMIPSHFSIVDDFKYTENGKIDVASLPRVECNFNPDQVAPRNKLERQICEIWQANLAGPSPCVKQSFFSLGGHSLTAMKVVAEVSLQLDVQVTVRDLFTHDTIERFAAFIQQQSAYQMIPSRTSELVPLSYQQQRIWFLHQLEGHSAQYNMPVALKLDGRLDKSAFLAAFDDVVTRHSVLRTHYENVNGKGIQVVSTTSQCVISEIDLSGETHQAERVTALINGDVARSFDLAHDRQMIRVTLVKLAQMSHVVIVNTHHIASDGWSVGVIIKDFSAAYQARYQGQLPNFNTLPIEYADFAAWQRSQLDAELETKVSFWQEYLADAPVVHSLPLDLKRPAEFRYQGKIHHQILEESVLSKLHQLAKTQNATLFNVLQTAFAILVARWSDCNDVLMGTPVAGRDRPELQEMVGLFVNTVVLRTTIQLESSFVDTLVCNVNNVNKALAQQDVPFEMLVDRLRVERSTAHAPLFQIMFSMQNIATGELQLPELVLQNIMATEHVAKFDLELSCGEVNGELKISWNYATSLFSDSTITRLAESFVKLLRGISSDAQSRIADIDILPDIDVDKLAKWNSTAADFDHSLRIPHLLAGSATTHADQVALQMTGHKALSYQMFNARVNQLANWLVAAGVKANQIVGVGAYRSYEMVIAIHAILKAGAAYLPIDPDLPKDRQAFIIKDSGIAVLLCQQSLKMQFEAHGVKVFDIADEMLAAYAITEPQVIIAPSDAAYMIYTSGTTGNPKGVVIEHLALSNRIYWMQQQYQLSADDVVLQKTPFNFDVSVWEFVWPLTVGAQIVLAKPEGHKEPTYLADLITDYKVTCLHFVPSMLNLMLQSKCLSRCDSLRLVFCSGEALPVSVASEFHRQHSGQLHNLYGPTEATIDVSYWESCADNAAGVVPIGKPIHNTQLFVLDSCLNQVPVGVAGELHIAGVGLARGYLNRPELNAEKFLTTCRISGVAVRIYKTGDLVRWLDDGNIEYLGRNDHQVKINGLRVELGEIEAHLLAVPGVKEAVVVAQEQQNGSLQLVAYYCASAPTDSEQLIAILEQKLPHYMVPVRWKQLPAMPLSANGKLDRKQLPLILQNETLQPSEKPYTDLQIQIAALWEAELDCRAAVCLDDNFFHLGGDSIKAISVVTKMAQVGILVSVKDIFVAKTVRQLAEQLMQRQTSQELVATPAPFELLTKVERQAIEDLQSIDQLDDAYPLTLLQQGMYFYGALHHEQGVYHDIFNVKVSEALNEAVFSQALQCLVDENEVLRASLLLYGKRPLQLIHRTKHLPLRVIDLTAYAALEQQQEIAATLNRLRSTPVQLESGYWHMTLFRLSNDSFQYVLDFHHAMWDGWSIANFNNRLFSMYRRFLEDAHAAVKPENPLPYSYYVAAEQAALTSHVAREFWQQQLANAQLPWWSQCHLTQSKTQALTLDASLSKQLTDCAKQLDVQEKSLLLAAHLILMALLSGKKEVLTSYVTNGRPELAGSEKTLGLFLNTIPMYQDLATMRWDRIATSVETAIQQAHAYRHFPVAEIQSMMALDLSASMFNFTNFHVYDRDTIGSKVKVEQSFEQNSYLWATEVAKGSSSAGDFYQVKFSAEQSAFSDKMLSTAVASFKAILQQLILCRRDNIQLNEFFSTEDQQRIQSKLYIADRPDFDWVTHLKRQAQVQPDATAIVAGSNVITYAQLVCNVQQWAKKLWSIGVKAGQVVALCIGRDPRYIEILIALFDIGAVYLPIDPSHPQERIDYVLVDSDAQFVIVNQTSRASAASTTTKEITLDELHATITAPAIPSRQHVPSQQLAYLIYTSGSTGNPKGVMISRQALNQFIYSASTRLRLDESVEWLSLTTAVFDISLLEMIAPLCNGGKLHMLVEHSQYDGAAIVDYIQHSNVNYVQATPSGWKLLLATNWRGKSELTGLCGGEALSVELADRLLQCCGRGVVNCYGPTEATVWSHMWDVQSNHRITLGQQLAGYGYCVANEHLEPVMPGVQGELLLTGHALADGYWRRPELTADKFVKLSWSNNTPAYRTGDLVFLNEKNELVYLGRIDEQVKIRGHRIELSEIENKLREIVFVKEAVVTAQQYNQSDVLVAYLLLTQSKESNMDLRHRVNTLLSQSLPEYMLPSFVMVLETLPMTPSGKLDKKRLPKPASEQATTFIAPQSDTEQVVQQIWSGLLGGVEHSVDERFFNVGGDSILATRLLTEINYQFGIDFTIKDIFSCQSIAEQALHIDYLKLRLNPVEHCSDDSVTEVEW